MGLSVKISLPCRMTTPVFHSTERLDVLGHLELVRTWQSVRGHTCRSKCRVDRHAGHVQRLPACSHRLSRRHFVDHRRLCGDRSWCTSLRRDGGFGCGAEPGDRAEQGGCFAHGGRSFHANGRLAPKRPCSPDRIENTFAKQVPAIGQRGPASRNQTRSNRSRFITLLQTATKAATNAASASSVA
jgi:hypothetical protein